MTRASAPIVVTALLLGALAAPALAQKPTPSPSPRKETPSYTGDDLDKIAGRKPGEAPKAVPAAQKPAPPDASPVDESAGSELPDIPGKRVDENAMPGGQEAPASWAERAKALREAVADAETKVKDLDSQAQALLWQYLQSTDTNEILRLKAEQQDILDQIPDAKKAVEDAQKALTDFEREAARAGVPPGEIREKKTP